MALFVCWNVHLCYLTDIFARLKVLNVSSQGKDSNIMDFTEKLSAFQSLIDLWMRTVSLKTLRMFPRLSSFVEDNSFDFDDVISNLVTSHLRNYEERIHKILP